MKRGARMAKKYKGDGVMSAMNGDKIVVVALKIRDWIILCFCLGILILPSVFYWRGASMDILQHSATWRKLGDGFRAVNGHSLSHLSNEQERLSNMLQNAAMADNTVIVTTLNKAWATKNSMLDLFLESFEIGEGTKPLLKHLIIVALDQTAYDRCLSVHNHCFMLQTDGVDFSGEKFFMTDGYLMMMWRRIKFLRTILQMGYNFVFTDADIMWFRNPFFHFTEDADIQIACDHFTGSSEDLENRPNGGFNFVKSNNRTIEFYKYWYLARNLYTGKHDQDVLNIIKFDMVTHMGLKIRFLDTAYFGGFCEPSRDLNEVCTMHANCCYGLSSKLHDIKVMLRDWKLYQSMTADERGDEEITWRNHVQCRESEKLKQN